MSDQQTPPTTPTTPPASTTPPPPPPAPGPDIAGNFKKLPLAEKVLACLALLVLIGWIITWSRTGGWQFYGLFVAWFPTLSFLGALSVAALVILKVLGIQLPPQVEKQVVPVASLLPVVGYLIGLLSPFYMFLTIGGSIALAYVSATTYWRKHIPEFVGKEVGGAGAAPPVAPAPPPETPKAP